MNEAKSGFSACEAVVDSYQTLEAEFENVVGIFANPAEYLSLDAIRVLWNFNSVYQDITNLVHVI